MAFTKISGSGISSEAPVIINNLIGVGAKLSGIVTAASYHGDGSSLDGISVAGIDTAATSVFNNVNFDNAISTGNLNIGGNSTFTGIVTVTGLLDATLNGNVIGNVTGNVTGNSDSATLATNAQGLTGSPNITVGDIVADNISVINTITYEDVTNVDSVGIVTARGGFDIGISSSGTLINNGPIKALNFVGTGNTFAVRGTTVDISIESGSGGGGGGSGLSDDDHLNKTLFINYSGFDSNTTIGSPQKFGEVFAHDEIFVDIEDGVTVSIDESCVLDITSKDDFDIAFFANGASATNIMKKNGFEDNIRSVFSSNIHLTGKAKVGYGKIPPEIQDIVSYDIEPGVQVTVDEGGLLAL